jgi:hypothetical protein
MARLSLHFAGGVAAPAPLPEIGAPGKTAERRVFKSFYPVAGRVALAVVAVLALSAVGAADDFPLSGNYTQNVACKGDGSDPQYAKVAI